MTAPKPPLTALLFSIAVALIIPTAISHTKHIPSEFSKLDEWIAQNIREFHERKAPAGHGFSFNRAALDHRLAMAEDCGAKVITVAKCGRADFRTVREAVESIPCGNSQRVVVRIGGGEYWEKILVDSSRKFVTFYGDPEDMPRIVYNGTALEYGTIYSATVAVESDYFMAVNIVFVNAAPMPDGKRKGAQAVAMRISGDKAAFHNCKFIGFQDTLCDDRGKHFFRDCFIQGTVDFIFGNGKSLYLNTTIHSVAEGMGVITAQARENVTDDSGFTFVHCNITGTGDTYLGRAWKQRPRVVFAYTYMGTLINDKGWSDAMHPNHNHSSIHPQTQSGHNLTKWRDMESRRRGKKVVYYGEYKCMGPGASPSGRVKYAKILTDAEAKPFLSMTYINGNKWLLPPPKL